MSERPKWIASDEEMRREFYENIHMETAVQHCDRVALRTGLRAQLAVLEELSDMEPEHHYREIERKIAALRKELGHAD